MNKKIIIFAVYDTLHHEYRGFKTAHSFLKNGYEVKVIGIRYDNDELKGWEGIENERIRLFKTLPLILNMMIFWIKLFFVLIREKCTVLYSHDIFPLLPVFLVSRLKRKPYIYDAHEFWHGNSQVEDRPAAKIFWTSYEKIFIKGAKRIITVSEPIARELERIYGLEEVRVFTNLPLKKDIPANKDILHDTAGIDKAKRIVLYQGHFLVNNGLDGIIRSFVKVDESAVLVLIGDGSEKYRLRDLAAKLRIGHRVYFAGPFPHSELINYTVCAYIGLCLIKNFGKSYYYSAPNKMFELIQAQVPQIASDFPEMSRYVKGYNVGEVTDPENEDVIAEKINGLLNDDIKYNSYKSNCIKAGSELVWESIEKELVKIAD
ncbi:MAG: glycosyltransferase [Candidatus Delongbacteria bacterium]|nr:glycosyltransferase [Candidatus Delongbacteria bacterium]